MNKKEAIKQTIKENHVDICCMQEVELQKDYPSQLMTFPGFSIEVEMNDTKSRVAILIKSTINYTRRLELEGKNSNLMIIDIDDGTNLRVINVYRSFNPQDNIGQREKFQYQLNLMKIAITNNTIILGDFNIDDGKRLNIDYAYRNYFCDLDEVFSEFGLVQLINFVTWSRLVGSTLKSSILDHVYVSDVTTAANVGCIRPCFGDHMMVTLETNCTKPGPKESIRRDWRFYSKEILCNKLSAVDWDMDVVGVQEYWNVFENKLINVIDDIVPLVVFTANKVKENTNQKQIKNIQNIRQRLLKKFKISPNQALKARIVSLDATIRTHYRTQKRNSVRRVIIPGNTKSLWTAVNIAKDLNNEAIPTPLFNNGNEINPPQIPEAFADYFDTKIKSALAETQIRDNVYNGKRKVISESKMFMSSNDILECLKSLKIKNCEGYDRIPQRILKDGADHLIAPLTGLFNLIYYTNKLPEQWLIAKVFPIHKKGSRNEVSNYRPISNLCSTSKVFEKLVLRRIMEVEKENGVDLTGNEQHGFKKCKSTTTAGLVIQSIISRALDENNHILMSSVDLTAAFDLVDVRLLIKRLHIIGLPTDIVKLIELWLSGRSFFVNVDGNSSILLELSCGIIQGSILGPILYAIYVSPLFDLAKLTNFADDNFVIQWNRSIGVLIKNMEAELETITGWLKDSGLKVNESKTEVCLFHRMDCQPIIIKVNNSPIKSKNSMNVLGVTFDSKLTWSEHINNCTKKAKRALHAIKLIRPNFTPDELKTIITSNFFSILYYNSEIWHLPNLSPLLKQQLLATSALGLKLCTPNYDRSTSYLELHHINKRATPPQFMQYKLSIQLFKLYNNNEQNNDWINLNFNQMLSRRQIFFETTNISNYRIGSNFLSNRLQILNKKIPLEWLNNPLGSFKIKCKKLFL